MELLSSFCRDFILIKEGGEGRFLINPDYEPALREIEKTFGLERLLNGLAQIDFAISGLSRHLNAGLLVSSLFSNFGEARNV